MVTFVRSGPSINCGKAQGCPFCIARAEAMPRIGDRIWIITGSSRGTLSTVTKLPSPVDENHFLAHVDDEPPENEIRVGRKWCLYHRLPIPKVPNWAPPLSIDDALRLDENVVALCNEWSAAPRRIPDFMTDFIFRLWRLRLPLNEEAIWQIAKIHGAPVQHRRIFRRRLREGLKLLSAVEPRKPIKAKLIKPLSKFDHYKSRQ